MPLLSSYVTDRLPVPEELTNEDPGTSLGTTGISTDSNSAFVTNVLNQHKSPEQIRPFPKAAARKVTKKGGKKPGRCRIVTDTPEKNEIEMMALTKTTKNFVTKRQKATKRIVDSSSDEDLINEFEISSVDSLDDVDFGNAEEEEKDFSEPDNKPRVGDFILTQIKTKKTKTYFVANVVGVTDDGFKVRYLKRSKFAAKFLFENDTIYDLPDEDVVMKLGAPSVVGGTARRNAEMTFSIDLSSFNVQ